MCCSLAPSPEDGVMGWRWKRDFEEGVIHPFARGGGGGEGSEWRLLTQQEMSRHIYTVVFPLCTGLLPNLFLKVTLHPIWFRHEGCFQKLSTSFSCLCYFKRHIYLPLMATMAAVICCCFFLKKLLWMNIDNLAPVSDVEQGRYLDLSLSLIRGSCLGQGCAGSVASSPVLLHLCCITTFKVLRWQNDESTAGPLKMDEHSDVELWKHFLRLCIF